ncbi:MAG TPA: hypothetical protein VFD39_02885 [Trueperaceae bacterium]|nr:hypothetical protein [Trueperaceae bacterium]
MRLDGRYLQVACSPVARVYLSGRGRHANRVSGRGMTRAKLPVDGLQGSRLRLTVIDAAGNRAWTNPFEV